MSLDELRIDIACEQKKGLPFIIASVFIWGMITFVSLMDLPIMTKNLLVFCCSCPLLPLSWIAGKIIKVDIFTKKNPLGQLGFLFTMNQMIYLLIVMWVFNAVPEKMIMVYAMVFGAHLFPYSWLYKSKAYAVLAVCIPIIALILGNLFNGSIVAFVLSLLEIVFAAILWYESKRMKLNREE
jgi:hypothetical protein